LWSWQGGSAVHPNELCGKEDRLRYMLAGRAKVTFESVAKGNHFTYMIEKHKEKELWFVSYLSGQDNENDYFYLGTIFPEGQFTLTKNSRVTQEATVFKAFQYVWNRIDKLDDSFRVYHEGSCGRCGRTLTDPESIRRGIGPECYRHLGA